MTAVIDRADARLAASTMMSSSISRSLTGAQIDWTMNTSAPRTLSRYRT